MFALFSYAGTYIFSYAIGTGDAQYNNPTKLLIAPENGQTAAYILGYRDITRVILTKLIISNTLTVTKQYSFSWNMFLNQVYAYNLMLDGSTLYCVGQIVKLNTDFSYGYKTIIYQMDALLGSLNWATSYGDINTTKS